MPHQPSAAAPFVHLHVHSEFSLVDGLLKVKKLVQRCAEAGMPAVALTDHGNLFALVKFYENCLAAGIKPILGAEVMVKASDDRDAPAERVVLLAKHLQGYRHLTELISESFTQAEERGALTETQIFAKRDGLLVLSGGIGGHLWRGMLADDTEPVTRRVQRWVDVFGDDYFIEITRTGRSGEDVAIQRAVQIAAALNVGIVATNDVCFAERDDFEAHETRVCINEGRTLNDPRRSRRYSDQQHFASSDYMATRFADLPQALSNTLSIAQKCTVEVPLGVYHLPDYPLPDNQSLQAFFHCRAREGLAARLAATGVSEGFSCDDYDERLDFELNVIDQMGFAGYFLIVMEFIGWAKEHKIPVGPGRGSGGGSLVAYALGITDLDPLQYDLLFERFLNPERLSMPDFDVDFCMEGRDQVIQHVSDLYGANAVSQIITFGTMAAKAVVRDVARVQGKAYGLADKLSKLIPFEVGMTLSKAMAESEDLKHFVETTDEAAEIMDMAYKLEGIVRNVGRHAGGVVIAPSALTDFVPLYTEEGGEALVSQFDKDDVERAGLVKFDFLGLKTLTIIDWTVAAINSARPDTAEAPLDIATIPLEDPAVYALLKRAETTAVFQLESRGMKDLIRRLLPDEINDIIALVALFRPGPLQSGAVDDYVDRKHGKAAVSFPHASLQGVLESTYGVVLYQEQVMQIAQVLAGFSLGQADLLRRAMGKKKADEMAKVREQFLTGTTANSIDPKLANEIFDLMEKFAGYAFNKSHSATYALVSFQTAWLKTHYPAEFMAANLSAEMHNIDRVVQLIDEVRRMQISLRPPSVNASEFRFSVREGEILYGLGAIRGVGEGPVEAILAARDEQPFSGLEDFCLRVGSKKANKRVVEALILAGAMDEFTADSNDLNVTRSSLLANLGRAMQGAEQVARNEAAGITDLFGTAEGSQTVSPQALEQSKPQTTAARLRGEKDTLGLFLTGHPIQQYEQEIRRFNPTRLNDIRIGKQNQWAVGMVVSSRVMKSRRGASLCFLVLDDRSARLEVSLFPEVYENYKSKVVKDEVLVVEGEVQADDFTGGPALRANKVLTIAEARQHFGQSLLIDYSNASPPSDLDERLHKVLAPRTSFAGQGVSGPGHAIPKPGSDIGANTGVSLGSSAGPSVDSGASKLSPITILYRHEQAIGRVSLGKDWRVQVTDELLEELKAALEHEAIEMHYPPRSATF